MLSFLIYYSNLISFYLYNFNIEWKSGLSVKTCFTAEWRPDGCRLYCILQVHKNFPNFDGINPSSQYLLKWGRDLLLVLFFFGSSEYPVETLGLLLLKLSSARPNCFEHQICLLLKTRGSFYETPSPPLTFLYFHHIICNFFIFHLQQHTLFIISRQCCFVFLLRAKLCNGRMSWWNMQICSTRRYHRCGVVKSELDFFYIEMSKVDLISRHNTNSVSTFPFC